MRLSQDALSTVRTARLVLADGTVFEGQGFGATGEAVGEVCFNTAMTGYQEILTDPSYAAQIVTFTFPHIGNVGANDDDCENSTDASATAARGAIVRADLTTASNHRSRGDLGPWMARRGIIGIAGVDTRALTARIRENGMPHGVIAHHTSGLFDIEALIAKAKGFSGLEGRDLAKAMTDGRNYANEAGDWDGESGFLPGKAGGPHVVVIDYGVKKNILRRLVSVGFRVSVVPPTASAETIMALSPDGVLLSNGPGDPAATGEYAAPVIRTLIDAKIPTFGICLGHQLLALAIGGRTVKMPQGHHGANHPVRDHRTGKVEIVSMNHGFAVDPASLPDRVEATYTSLFDGSNAGIRLKDAPALSVQHHPEASPGPQDSFGLFDEFVAMVRANKKAA
ncbi:glutamine-hydrolyzing carbamoyl-phosphate synthase small subunit [Parvularcula sp. LCG005]|uniref:glutamine-hydrolyzing carbamoyl-phosphate synthase small subunit n=1 Tax=Parvularcula sp. LCG005 TaxID=3078805 RepID=UPI0029431E99|nr:glutamine-hydrolyzing carbamoyl-phosphate synthase small subunit [Parvularcula sp. LCG005]WOI52046.1 glutamine-hydrolyzing carbamoyl-phosphate synthase small subunit [Parvularcula sp. LCG005]